ncbi:MAG: type II toxin-antitoxin system HicA family toxin [Pseudomonadota bacterium]
MTKRSKLIDRLKSKPKDFTWDEFSRLLVGFGYELAPKGKSSGSRRKFYHEEYGHISLHEPHPTKILKRYQLNQVLELLQKENLI